MWLFFSRLYCFLFCYFSLVFPRVVFSFAADLVNRIFENVRRLRKKRKKTYYFVYWICFFFAFGFAFLLSDLLFCCFVFCFFFYAVLIDFLFFAFFLIRFRLGFAFFGMWFCFLTHLMFFHVIEVACRPHHKKKLFNAD